MTAYDFNADDIFKMAEEIERNGAKFYRNAAGGISDEGAKKLLLELADMEDEHEETFSGMRKGLSEEEKKSTAYDPDNMAGQYLKSLADTRVFFEKDIDTSSMKEILKAAIVAEKESIVFYLGMKEFVPENLGKDKLDRIIKEEMSHITRLAKEMQALNL